MNQSHLIKELQATGKFMMHADLSWGNAGNISARIDEETYLITGSGTFLGELGEHDFAKCKIGSPGQEVKDNIKPSKETPMHEAIYINRPDIGAVLHASPFYSTLVASTKDSFSTNWIVETMYYLEKIERVPYFHPGSQKLGNGVFEKSKLANVLLLENHGVLVYDTNLKEAQMTLQTLEFACKMWVTAKSAGITLREIPQDVVRDFLEKGVYKPVRNWNL